MPVKTADLTFGEQNPAGRSIAAKSLESIMISSFDYKLPARHPPLHQLLIFHYRYIYDLNVNSLRRYDKHPHIRTSGSG